MPEFAEDFLVAQLRAAAVKVTRPRLRVLACLGEAAGALCHGELEQRLNADGAGAIDRVTLYRVLDSLVDCRLALRTVDARGVYRFLLAAKRASHMAHAHFHCQQCGGVSCLDEVPVPAPQLPAGFVSRQVDVDVRGLCGRCSGLPDQP
jgi:Fur family ferric uptake transcriptional regulator